MVLQIHFLQLHLNRDRTAIAMTAVDTEEGRDLALRYGFQTYLIKPIEPDELMLEIAKLVKIQPKEQQSEQNLEEITSTDESLFVSELEQVEKLPIQTESLNKGFDNKVVARAKELITDSKQLQIQYHDLGSRFVAFKAHFTQIKQKLSSIKPYISVQ
ncbi:hypothetical protein F7734_28210 [Scytonema sp. UIC 10036]|uniref:hypothetical protein n=1 Tax=Scytonema sp. UIC 10036 TaxID=2304196 RepID=UPI0012DAD8A5|nr:hypothetical protein [Scytonema sp. UIC 10036]MUG96020.1 hypothetical protein [Scytonema sp. UIC 10036]